MKKLYIFPLIALPLLAAACATTGYQDPVPVTGNGTEPCVKKECLKPACTKGGQC